MEILNTASGQKLVELKKDDHTKLEAAG